MTDTKNPPTKPPIGPALPNTTKPPIGPALPNTTKPPIGPALPKTTNPQTFSLLPKVINGGIAGIIGVSMLFPIDLVKTRMQNQVRNPQGVRQYKNIIDCFRQVVSKEGYFGMYRGSAVNIILVTPEKAIKLTANDMFRYYLTLPNGTIPIFRQMIAGGLAGLCQVIITTPMELLKIQMQDAGRVAAQKQTEGKQVERLTAWKVTRKLVSEQGITALYKGFDITMSRDVTFSCIYFPLYSVISDLGVEEIKPGATPPIWWSFVSGITAGLTAAFLATPFDVIKTRMQTLTKGAYDQKCSTITECASQTMKAEGITAFFKGSGLRMMVIAPLFGIVQSVYYIGIAEKLFGL